MGTITFQAVLSAITTVGFPIVVCLGLFYFCYWFVKESRKENLERETKLTDYIQEREAHCEAMQEKTNAQLEKFADTLNSFNETLIKIDNRVEIIETIVKK